MFQITYVYLKGMFSKSLRSIRSYPTRMGQQTDT